MQEKFNGIKVDWIALDDTIVGFGIIGRKTADSLALKALDDETSDDVRPCDKLPPGVYSASVEGVLVRTSPEAKRCMDSISRLVKEEVRRIKSIPHKSHWHRKTFGRWV